MICKNYYLCFFQNKEKDNNNKLFVRQIRGLFCIRLKIYLACEFQSNSSKNFLSNKKTCYQVHINTYFPYPNAYEITYCICNYFQETAMLAFFCCCPKFDQSSILKKTYTFSIVVIQNSELKIRKKTGSRVKERS